MSERRPTGAHADGVRARAKRLLVVEDDSVLAEALGRLFARRGCVVCVASTVGQAEIQVAHARFDCGVFDIELGSHDGICLAARFLTTGSVGSAVFYSATIDAEARRRASNIGTFVSKVAPFDELATAVYAALLGFNTDLFALDAHVVGSKS